MDQYNLKPLDQGYFEVNVLLFIHFLILIIYQLAGLRWILWSYHFERVCHCCLQVCIAMCLCTTVLMFCDLLQIRSHLDQQPCFGDGWKLPQSGRPSLDWHLFRRHPSLSSQWRRSFVTWLLHSKSPGIRSVRTFENGKLFEKGDLFVSDSSLTICVTICSSNMTTRIRVSIWLLWICNALVIMAFHPTPSSGLVLAFGWENLLNWQIRGQLEFNF